MHMYSTRQATVAYAAQPWPSTALRPTKSDKPVRAAAQPPSWLSRRNLWVKVTIHRLIVSLYAGYKPSPQPFDEEG